MSTTIFIVIQIAIITITPWLLIHFVGGKKIAKIASPVVLAYVTGILVRMTNVIPLHAVTTDYFIKGTILLAIPLLLFNADIAAWLKHAKSTVLSFVFCIIAALISATIFAFVFNVHVDKIWEKSGMLVGIFTGGTANLFAVGAGINADPASIGLLNATEIIWGGLYLIFLTSILPKVYGMILPTYQKETEEEYEEISIQKINWKETGIAILLSIGVIAATLGLNVLLVGSITNNTLIILLLTSISVIFSFVPKVRKLRGSFEAGDYLLLIFCVAIGLTFDLKMLIESGLHLFLYTGAVMLTAIGIHLLLSKIFKIDRDTTIITSTAAIYGPAFIGQVAQVLQNREVILAGISTGLIGYAVGNFLGISLSGILHQLLL